MQPDDMRRYIDIKPVPQSDELVVYLHVGNQWFNVTPTPVEPEYAEFMASMLCIALAQIVDEARGDVK